MTSYLGLSPAIRWGANLANRIDFGYRIDHIKAYDADRDASEWVQAPSGVEDAWITGTDYRLDSVLRYVPGVDTADPVATGWDGALGWREFLKWARQKNQFAFHPDGRNMLRVSALEASSDVTVAPSIGLFDHWAGGLFGGATTFTISYDASVDSGRGAWKIVASNPAASSVIDLRQFVPARPGEQFCLSADIMTASLAGGASPQLIAIAFDSGLAGIASVANNLGPISSGSLTRFSTGLSSAAPVNTAYILAILRLDLPAATTPAGTVWFKNVMLARGSSSPTFVSNPSILSYTSEGNASAPDQEDDGTRTFPFGIRNATTAYDGY